MHIQRVMLTVHRSTSTVLIQDVGPSLGGEKVT